MQNVVVVVSYGHVSRGSDVALRRRSIGGRRGQATKSEEDGARGKKAKRAKEEEEAPKAQGSDSDAEGAGLQRKVPGALRARAGARQHRMWVAETLGLPDIAPHFSRPVSQCCVTCVLYVHAHVSVVYDMWLCVCVHSFLNSRCGYVCRIIASMTGSRGRAPPAAHMTT